MSDTRTVSGLAAETGVSPDTVRYYERLGLLSPAERTASGYRLFDERAAERVRFIRGAQRVGLRLREIRDVIEIMDRGQCPCGHTEALLRQRLSEVRKEIDRRKTLERDLARPITQHAETDCQAPEQSGWWCAEAFASEGR